MKQKELNFNKLCHHTWTQISAKDCGENIEYTHECPRCGYVKHTLRRKPAKLDAATRYNRELDRLRCRARCEGLVMENNGFVPAAEQAQKAIMQLVLGKSDAAKEAAEREGIPVREAGL